MTIEAINVRLNQARTQMVQINQYKDQYNKLRKLCSELDLILVKNYFKENKMYGSELDDAFVN